MFALWALGRRVGGGTRAVVVAGVPSSSSVSLLLQGQRAVATSAVLCGRGKSHADQLRKKADMIPADIQELVEGTSLQKAATLKQLYSFVFSGPPPVNYQDYVTVDVIKKELEYLYPDPLKTRKEEPHVKRVPMETMPRNCVELDPHFRPRSLAYFTGNSRYYDLLTEYELMFERLDTMLKQTTYHPEGNASPPRWMTKEQLEDHIGEAFKKKMYDTIVALFSSIYTHPHYEQLGPNVLKQFIRSETTTEATHSAAQIDSLGRAHSVGKRKTSVARVWVWRHNSGDGADDDASISALSGDATTSAAAPPLKPRPATFKVNGKPLAKYFKDKDRVLEACAPLRFLDQMGNFSVMCNVHGGGVMGQSAAISLGVSKALSLLQPEFHDDLSANEFLVRDARTVEPKKPGQKKARKKFQWVKR